MRKLSLQLVKNLILLGAYAAAVGACKAKSEFGGQTGKKAAVPKKTAAPNTQANAQPTSTPPDAAYTPAPSYAPTQPPGAYLPQPRPTTQLPATPPGAVVRGSFTVWANPPNPVQHQPYAVHIRVKLPPNIYNYSQHDLSGRLEGTDNYFQIINGAQGNYTESRPMAPPQQKFYYTPGSGYAEMVLPVPGALTSNVRDTITVSSGVANDSQILYVQFR